jgi:3-oxoacyl-[acyl-carrier protein] reductase
VIGDPAPGLVDELRPIGAEVEVVLDVRNLRTQDEAGKLVRRALERFGRIDATAMFSGEIVVGPFLGSTVEQLWRVYAGCVEAPYHFLRAVTPPMVERGEGQMLVISSAAGARPTPNAPPLLRDAPGATMLARNVAGEVAHQGVQVNAVGSSYIDFPELLRATGRTTPEGRAHLEAQALMSRLGTLEEFAAFCVPFIDGTSRFTTGQFVAYAGGWA